MSLVWKWQDLDKELIGSDEWHLRGETRLWISVEVAGLKLDKYGGMIGKRWGSGNQMREIWNECVQLCYWKIGGINWQVIVCQVCHAGDEFEGLQWSIEFKVSQSVRGFLNKIFVSSHMYPENPERTQVIVGSMNMGYISDTVRNRTHNLIYHKRDSGADTTRPQWRVGEWFCEKYSNCQWFVE